MDDLLRLAGTVSGTAIDWVVIFCFVAFAVIYFLAPVLGYPSERRGPLLISLYLLVAYGVLVLLQLVIQYLIFLANSNGERSGRFVFHLAFIFGIFKLVIFLVSQASFVFGLQGLRRSPVAGE